MNVLICIKVILRKVDSDKSEYEINPYDLFALQYIIERKEQFGLTVTCLCMGPAGTKYVLKDCYALGADQVYFINDHMFAGSDTYATAYIISKAIKKIGYYQLVICGCRTLDGDTGQVSYGIAKHLEISSVDGVTEILQLNADKIVIKRDYDNFSEIVCGMMPLLLIFKQFSIDKPIFSFKQLKKARSCPISVLSNNDLNIDEMKCGLKGSLTKVLDMKRTYSLKESIVIDGDLTDVVEKLLNIMDESSNWKVRGKE